MYKKYLRDDELSRLTCDFGKISMTTKEQHIAFANKLEEILQDVNYKAELRGIKKERDRVTNILGLSPLTTR